MDTARVSVQFQSVIEKLTPHDTVFAFTKSSELQESTLSLACSLHTASASIKSKDSSPHRGLAGITEDASESRTENQHDGRSADNVRRGEVYVPRTPEDPQTRPEKVNGRLSAENAHNRSPSIATETTYRPRTTSDTNKALPPPPEDSIFDDAPRSILNYGDYNTRPSVDERYSSQSARPSTRDLHNAYEYKPKVKLGPRPSMDSQRSPDGSHRLNDFRPVASLPAGLRMPSRKEMSGRPVSRHAQNNSPEKMSPKEMPLPPPKTPISPIQIPDRKLSTPSNGHLISLKTPESSSPKMTPEKRRLMKALQLRQKQLAAQKPVNRLGIEALSDGQEADITKPEVDDTVPSAMFDVSALKAESTAVHVAVSDLSKEEPPNLEASPISIAETSEGPSTQASSITDEEDRPSQKTQEHDMNPKPTMSLVQDLPLHDHPKDVHHMIRTETIRAPEKIHETDPADDAPSIGDSDYVTKPSIPLPSDSQDQTERCSLETRTRPSPVDDQSRRTTTSPLAEENEDVPIIDNEAPAIAQSTPVAGVGRSPEARTHDSVTENGLKESAISRSTPAECESPLPKQHVQTSGATDPEDGQTHAPEFLQMPLSMSSQARDAHVNEVNEDEKASLKPSQASTPAAIVQEKPQPPFDENPRTDFEPPQPSPPAVAVVPKMPILAVNEEVKGNTEPSEDFPPTAPGLRAPPKDERELSVPPMESKRQSQASDLTVTQPSSSNTVHEPQTERSARRRRVINPVERMSSAEQSDEHFLSDDSFMEELKSATLQEAKPVSVSKSPIKPVFSRSESEQRIVDTRTSRSVSSPSDQPRNNEEVSPSQRPPTAASTRSFSASHAARPGDQPPPMPLPKKIGVSSGISQRIKALEQFQQSSRPTSPQSQTTPPNPSAFINLRKNAQRSPPSAADVNRNLSTQKRPSTAYPSPSPSPDYVKWNPFSQSKKTGASRPESVSVTATIIRDATNKTPEMPMNPSEPRAMDLHQSPLVVEHQKMEPPPPPLSPLKPPRPRYARYSSARSGSSSSTDQTQKMEKPPNSRRESFASIHSKSSRAGSEPELPRSMSDSSLGSPGSPDDKKDSKRSRLLKRMSSISSMSRRSIAHALSPGPKEGPILESQEPIAETPSASSMVEVGDVNVQFPDTLVSPASFVHKEPELTDIAALEETSHADR